MIPTAVIAGALASLDYCRHDPGRSRGASHMQKLHPVSNAKSYVSRTATRPSTVCGFGIIDTYQTPALTLFRVYPLNTDRADNLVGVSMVWLPRKA